MVLGPWNLTRRRETSGVAMFKPRPSIRRHPNVLGYRTLVQQPASSFTIFFPLFGLALASFPSSGRGP